MNLNPSATGRSPASLFSALASVHLALTTGAVLQLGAAEAIFSASPGTGGYVNGTAGWTFQPLTGVTVTSLGCFADALAGQSPLWAGLWSADGALLGTSTITPGSPLLNQSRYEAIAPVSLMAGATYHLGAAAPSGTLIVAVAGPGEIGGSVSLAPELQLGGAIAHIGPGLGFPDFVLAPPGSAVLVPNFLFEVPEPATTLLLPLAGLVFVVSRKGLRTVVG